MKHLLLSFACAFSLCTSVFAQDSHDELLTEESQISLLIDATKLSLEHLQQLQKHLHSFRRQEAKCIDSPNDTEGLYQLSACALQLLQSIQKANVEPYFRPAFLEELVAISKTAQHKTLPTLTP